MCSSLSLVSNMVQPKNLHFRRLMRNKYLYEIARGTPLQYFGKALDISWSGPVGKHLSCMINVATRNLFTIAADISALQRSGRVQFRKWLSKVTMNRRLYDKRARTKNSSRTRNVLLGSFVIYTLPNFKGNRNISNDIK